MSPRTVTSLFVASFTTLTIAFAGAGCSSSGGATSDEESKSTSASATTAGAGSFCAAYCQKRATCDSSEDAQTCTESCETDVSGIIKKLRSDVITSIQSCWEHSDCRQVLSGNRLDGCIDEAAVNATPTAAAKSFCDAYGVAARKCDGDLNYAKCLGGMKIFGDETLEQAQKCTEKSCSVMSSCIKATL